MNSLRGVIITALLIIVILLLNMVVPGESVFVYVVAFICSSLLFLLLVGQILATDIPVRMVGVLVVCALCVRLGFLTMAPIGSDDVYRYMWDAKVASYGFNPYEFSPEAKELASLRSDHLPSKVNHPSMKTVYFPVAEWIFMGGYWLSGEEIWGYKLELFVAEILTILGLVFLVREAGQPLKHVLLYALCPLPIVSFAIDAHIDGFGLPFLVGALVLYLRNRKLPALVLLGLSIAIKPVAFVALPILFFYERGIARRVWVILVPMVIVTAQFMPYLGGGNLFESLTTYTERWMFNGSLFHALLILFRQNELTRIVCGVLLACSIVLTVMSRYDLPTKVSLAIFLLLVFSPVVHPWYVAWLAVLLPAVPRWSAATLTATVSLAAITVLGYASHGEWREYPLVMIAEYLPVVVLFFRELPRRPDADSPAISPE